MNFEKLYENIILRDLIEYLTPGAIFVFSVCLISESLARALAVNISVFAIIKGSTLASIFVALVAYASGHFLTAVSTSRLRDAEQSGSLTSLIEDEFIRLHIIRAISSLMKISESDAAVALNQPESFSSIREIARTIIQERMQSAYREFVIRHSILSRFCQNMVIALSALLLSSVMSALIMLYRIWDIYKLAPRYVVVIAGLSALIFLATIVYAIRLFLFRASRLRRTMIRHTFEIWYADSLMPSRKENLTGNPAK